jgi:signal transduction histidine kinase
MDRKDILAKLARARDDIHAVVDAMASGDERRLSWTRLLAHNVNNHLTSVFFIIERFIQPEEAATEKQAAYVDALKTVAERIQETIRRLMTISQFDSLVLLAPVDLGQAVLDTVERSHGYAGLKSIDLQCKIFASSAIIVEADRLGLIEALLNLIGNAIKYSPRGSKVEVTVRATSDDVEVRVQDHGPGISIDEQTMLFKVGGVLSTKPTGGEPQTGIGLAMTYELIKAMHGTIWCESAPGRGAMFGIRLALSKRSAVGSAMH